ncbi:hypothetical protein RFI_32575 [Reticulomyxa filosa]|uniref:Uncharacterized protein n=1 Tax=Reticulomyxa filosa TaxID=46433 RepID=X6LTX7_RETFI|nr:hypothetical protein RFI_32575 [Reticulomyxa filosa]|eukprot:ETO04821.1 hypothetical protein RFI_32575 [Reticulomyxa filosa]
MDKNIVFQMILLKQNVEAGIKCNERLPFCINFNKNKNNSIKKKSQKFVVEMRNTRKIFKSDKKKTTHTNNHKNSTDTMMKKFFITTNGTIMLALACRHKDGYEDILDSKYIAKYLNFHMDLARKKLAHDGEKSEFVFSFFWRCLKKKDMLQKQTKK